MNRLDTSGVEEILANLNAIHKDSHFVYTSGKHGPHYIDKDAVGVNPTVTDQLGFELACRVDEYVTTHIAERTLDCVIGAPMGAIRFSDRVAFWLNTHFNYKVQSLYADKSGDDLKIRKAFQGLLKCRGVVLIEDIINSGKSVRLLKTVVEDLGVPLLVGALCNRGGQTAESLGVPNLISLIDVKFEAFEEAEMPDWLRARPVRTDLGHGQEYLDELERKRNAVLAGFGMVEIVSAG